MYDPSYIDYILLEEPYKGCTCTCTCTCTCSLCLDIYFDEVSYVLDNKDYEAALSKSSQTLGITIKNKGM